MNNYLFWYYCGLKLIIMFLLLILIGCCTKRDCPCMFIESFSVSFYNNNGNSLKIEIIDKSNGQSVIKELKDSYFYIGSYGSVIPKSIKDYTYILNYQNIKDTIKEIYNTQKISSGICNKCFIVFDGDKYKCTVFENYKIKINNKIIEGNEISY